MNIVTTIIKHWDLLWNLVVRDLKIRYRGSVLGFLWTILNPLFMALIYIIFLRLLAGRGIASQYEAIIIGVFAWQFTMQCVNGGLPCITGNGCLVKKVFFPRIILPLSVVVSNLVNFLLTLLVQWGLILFMLMARGQMLEAATPLALALSVYQMLFNLSLTLLVATLNVYFRDTQYVVNLLLSAWFFMTPVMYPMSVVELAAKAHPWIASMYMLNPMSVIITGYRVLQLPGETFPWSTASVIGLLLPLVMLVGAYAIFQRCQKNFSDVL